MLSSQKKRSDRSPANVVPAWHPNFRDAERLPDTKPVRTSFFINVFSFFLVASLALYATYREVKLNALRQEVEQARTNVQSTKAGSDQAVAQYKLFQEEEKKVKELKTFREASKIVVSDFILRIGEGLPPEITLRAIECRPTVVTLRGEVEGAPDEATGRAVAYVEGLKSDEFYAKLFDNIKLANIVRDPGTGRMQAIIDLAFKEPPKPPAKAKKK